MGICTGDTRDQTKLVLPRLAPTTPRPDSAEVKARAAHLFAKDVDLGPSIRLRTDEQVKLLHEIAEFYAEFARLQTERGR